MTLYQHFEGLKVQIDKFLKNFTIIKVFLFEIKYNIHKLVRIIRNITIIEYRIQLIKHTSINNFMAFCFSLFSNTIKRIFTELFRRKKC